MPEHHLCHMSEDLVAELAALRRVARMARKVVRDCKGTGVRFFSLIKALEILDEVLWDAEHPE